MMKKDAYRTKAKTLLRKSKRKILRKLKMEKREPEGDKYYGDKAKHYVRKRKKQKKWHRENEIVRDLLGQLPDNLRVLDVPFGTGRFLPFYLEKDFQVYGLDASEDMLSAAEEECGEGFKKANLQIGDASHLPYEDQYFDIVVCARFLTSIVGFGQAKKVLEEISRVTSRYALVECKLKKNGKTAWPGDEDPIGRNITYEDMTDIFKSFGFSVQSSSAVKSNKRGDLLIFFLKKVN